MVTIGVIGSYHLPFSLTSDPKDIISFEFADLSPDEQEVVQELPDFKFTSSRTLITLDRGDSSEIDEYLGEYVVEKYLYLKVFLSISITHIFI